MKRALYECELRNLPDNAEDFLVLLGRVWRESKIFDAPEIEFFQDRNGMAMRIYVDD